MHGMLAITTTYMAAASSAADVMRSFVSPVIVTLCAVGSLACVFFLVNGGISYVTSTGKPENLDHAKRVIRNALIGLVLIFAAGALTQILTHAYGGSSAAMHASTPNLTAITPKPVSNGLVGVIIKAITGVLNDIIQSLASPFIKSLAYFTKSTPLMADNSTVFNMWLAVVGMTDALFVLVVALLGFHVMSVATFGLDEIEFKHLLPRLGLIFLALNTSIFAIDGIIELSNAMIHAANLANGTTSLWDSLTAVVKQSAELGLPSLLIMMLFTIFAVVLVLYYLIRLISLYIGAILSPLVLLLWLIPGFRDFSETAAKVYIVTIFVLFVQVVVLIVSGSLIAGVVVGSPTQTTGTLMPMVAGVAAMYAVLKVPGFMTKLSFVSMGPQSVRQLGGQFLNGVSFMTRNGKKVAGVVSGGKSSGSNGNKGGNGSNDSKDSNGGTQNSQDKRTASRMAMQGDVFTEPRLASETMNQAKPKTSDTVIAKQMNKSTSKAHKGMEES